MKTLVSVGELIDGSWKTLQQQWRPTLKYTLWIFLIPLAFSLANAGLSARYPELAESISYNLVSSLVMLLALVIPSLKLFKFMLGVDRDPAKTPDTSINVTDLLQLWLILILTVLVLIPAYLLLIIPGIWISQLLAFPYVLYLEDGKVGVDAMKTSWKLVSGRWWAVFIRQLVPSLLYGFGAGFAMILLFLSAFLIGALLFGAGTFIFNSLAASAPAVGVILIALGVILGVILGLAVLVIYGAVAIAAQLLSTAVFVRLFHSLKETQS